MATEVTVVDSESNFLIAVTDVSKIFLGRNLTEADTYVNNSGYNPIALKAGTVMGRVGSTGIVVPSISTASDGSQIVLGILGQDLVIASGATVKALIFVAGLVAQEQVIFVRPGDNLDTVVSNRQYRDKIQGETVGIKLVPTAQNTYADNY